MQAVLLEDLESQPLRRAPEPAPGEYIIPPQLETESPLVTAGNSGDAELYAILAAAAKNSEPRVRELIALVKEARAVLHADGVHDADSPLARLEFGLGGLLPPIGVTIKLRAADVKSLTGRPAA